MDRFLRVDDDGSNLRSSPSNSFIADEVASICPLITPSPPTNDLINPPPENGAETNYGMEAELATMLQQVRDGEKNAEDSASSSSSALAEPACTQLLNHRNTYHHITKDEETVAQESNGKSQPLQLTFKNPPDNYFFMSWNWPLIRKILLWLFMSGLVAMVALVVAMISALPRTCNPPTQWYQGSVMYEIFPASFADSNSDMIGDFKGIADKADYLRALGVRAVRLNSIFATQHYPEDYRTNVSTLTEIAPQLGSLSDFRMMLQRLHLRNISIVLDLPVFPAIKHLSDGIHNNNNKDHEPSVEFLKINPDDIISTTNSIPTISDLVEQALNYWMQIGVDGFYLKGLEYFIGNINASSFVNNLSRWKKLIGPNRPLIINQHVIMNSTAPLSLLSESQIDSILHHVDLIDVRLDIEHGVAAVTKQIELIQNMTLFTQRDMPWIMWTVGDDKSMRLANVLPYGNGTLGVTLLQLMLPGTPSIFYGDEIGLQQIADPLDEREDLKHLHQLAAMVWSSSSSSSSSNHNNNVKVLSWMHSDGQTINNFEQIELITKMIRLRGESPAIYVNSVCKQGDNRANAEVKYSRKDLLVIQRWYPRRKSYVVVSNLGNKQINADLSTLLYSGDVLVGPRFDSKAGSVSFKNISLWPGESVVILLD